MEFTSPLEKELSQNYLKCGHVIKPVENLEGLREIRSRFHKWSQAYLESSETIDETEWLNGMHTRIEVAELNDLRLHLIGQMNELPHFRELLFSLAKQTIEAIVGNELVMQARVNLSIQLPQDDSSLLHTHADTWSGDSPFEAVLWLPLVDVYETKSMYLLPPATNQRLNKDFKNLAGTSSDSLFESIKDEVEWMKIDYGNFLLFNQTLPHGNRVNQEPETRWSLNCRFKSVFSPYGDKKLGEFFHPISLKAASRVGLDYEFPST
jgi:sporadic carbohydrate cluster 2OG-Fe(II) oxygenase